MYTAMTFDISGLYPCSKNNGMHFWPQAKIPFPQIMMMMMMVAVESRGPTA